MTEPTTPDRPDRPDRPLSPPGKNPASPVVQEVLGHSAQSFMAVVGHPIHAMLVHFPVALVMATLACDLMYWWGADVFWLRAGLWAAGGAFATGVAASVVGVMEILAVRGIRARVASWSHAVAGLTLLAIMGANWGVRFGLPEGQLAHQLVLSVMAAISAGYAGWHGGKLVFDEGVGLKINPGD